MNAAPSPPVTSEAEFLSATCPDCGKPIRAAAERRAGCVWVGALDPTTFRAHMLAGCDLIRLSRALSAAAMEATRVQVFKIRED